MSKDEDNIVRLAFSAEIEEKLDEDYMDAIMEKVQKHNEPPIMIFYESNTIWIPPRLKPSYIAVVGILQKWIHNILHAIN